MWHLDGYDKLKPFGFPIHGCMIHSSFSYSRKILWLPTNNDPKVVATYYLKATVDYGGLELEVTLYFV